MDKLVAEKIGKVSNYIPDDLAFSILLRLPLKSLKQFEFVCKSWSLLLENPNFMRLYGINFLSKNHAFYDDTSLLLHQELDSAYNYDGKKCVLYSISGDRFDNKVQLDWPNLFQEDDDKGFIILGSCSINGILCLRGTYRWDFVFWNPATKEIKVIPHSPIESNTDYYIENCIFGYDRVRDDYKMIRHATIWLPMEDTSCAWEIYSLRSNTWKKVDVDVPMCIDYQQVYMDGVGHWWSKLKTHNEAYLVSFDFSNEIFFTTHIPSDIMGENFDFTRVQRYLLVLNGSIALIDNNIWTTIFHISILGEVGVEDSWTKLFVVGLLPCIDSLIGVWKNGDMFFRKKDGELVWFDLNTHMTKELGIITTKYRFSSKIVIYKESYLPIGGTSD